MQDRRSFLRRTSAALGAALVAQQVSATPRTSASVMRAAEPHFACNQYTWTVYFRREGRDFNADLDVGLAEVAAAGLDGFEPSATSPDEIDRMAPLLEKHGLAMRSVYVNSTLHKEDEAEASIADVLAIAERAKAAGTEIIVTNPSPIQWGGAENKTDAELRVQAAALDRLGGELADRGLMLAYHMHDPEFRAGAREFHHMLVGTDPAHVTFCCDAHWAYPWRGRLRSSPLRHPQALRQSHHRTPRPPVGGRYLDRSARPRRHRLPGVRGGARRDGRPPPRSVGAGRGGRHAAHDGRARGSPAIARLSARGVRTALCLLSLC
ncbi:MAG: sugar phosphate isomerase/epimerase family protein [Rhodothermales bacterium]